MEGETSWCFEDCSFLLDSSEGCVGRDAKARVKARHSLPSTEQLKPLNARTQSRDEDSELTFESTGYVPTYGEKRLGDMI